MQRKYLIARLVFFMIPMAGILHAQSVHGVYRLSGGQEMVAVFEFKKDSSFEFMFAYGAVDRGAKGHYLIRNEKIFLQSDKQTGKDFNIVLEEHRGDGTTIKISNDNSALIRNITGIFKKGAQQDIQSSDEAGLIHSVLKDCDTIYVVHQLYPDVPTSLIKKPSGNNYFQLTLNPSLADVSFHNFFLTITKEGLTGSLPDLFEKENALFIREPD